eukprot:scaffold104114_cov41-Prasinocladus_malaysianus.AAC.1
MALCLTYTSFLPAHHEVFNHFIVIRYIRIHLALVESDAYWQLQLPETLVVTSVEIWPAR